MFADYRALRPPFKLLYVRLADRCAIFWEHFNHYMVASHGLASADIDEFAGIVSRNHAFAEHVERENFPEVHNSWGSANVARDFTIQGEITIVSAYSYS
ncbi:hypothetical protein D3C80_1420830 [compost metagenome]